jgi:hypothetical protein
MIYPLEPVPPPSTVDFLTSLRNNFKDIIVPALPQNAREAFLTQKSPDEMTPIEAKRIRFAILGAVYGKTVIYINTMVH